MLIKKKKLQEMLKEVVEAESEEVTKKYYLIHLCTGNNILVANLRFEFKIQKNTLLPRLAERKLVK